MKRLPMALSLFLAVVPRGGTSRGAQKPSETNYEMTTYYLVLLHRGPKSTGSETPDAERIQDAHMANIRRMADEGKLIMAGPISDDGKLRGIFVLRAGSLQDAQGLAAADPAVMAGRLVPEVHPWFTAKNIRVYPTADAAGAASDAKGEADHDAEQEIRDLETRRFKAQTDADPAALDHILSGDLTYTHSSGQVDTKARYIAAIQSGELKYRSISTDEVKVRVYASAAVVTGRAAIKAESRGQVSTMQLRYTDTYVRQGGRWQMVAWESTRIPDP